MMRCMMYIAVALMLLCGCSALRLRRTEAADLRVSAEPAKRPEWFQGRFRSGTSGADKFVAHWEAVFRKGSVGDDAFLEANRILDAAIMESIGDASATAVLQHNHIVNDCMFALYKSHEALEEAPSNIEAVSRSTLYGRRFAAMLKANEERFAEWLPKFREWDRANGDWSGAEWSMLFDKRKVVGQLPELWMGREAADGVNLAVEKIDAWREAENFPVRLGKDIEGHLKQGKRLWLLQAIDRPEVPEGVRIYMNLHAFPGRCKFHVNAKEAVSVEDAAPRSLCVPLDFADGRQCIVVMEILADAKWADAVQHAPWPIWLTCDRK